MLDDIYAQHIFKCFEFEIFLNHLECIYATARIYMFPNTINRAV